MAVDQHRSAATSTKASTIHHRCRTARTRRRVAASRVDIVNAEIRHHLQSAARPLPPHPVVGVGGDASPPVGVIAGDHPVVNGDQAAFEQGLWATAVTAHDPDTAQAWAVAEMRHHHPEPPDHQ